jgi:flagellar FliL protein
MAKKPAKPAAEGDETEEGKPARKGIAGFLKSKIVLAGLAAVILLGGGGFGAMKMGYLGGGHGTDAAHEGAAAAEEAKGTGEHGGEAGQKKLTFVDLPEMTINLDAPDRPQYLRVKIALEVGEEKLAKDIQPLMPRVLDTFQTYMRQLRPTDLEGSAGLFRLKEELTKRVNVAVYPSKVDAVLFKEIVVQ